MILGMPYIVWLGILGAIGLVLYISPSKKKEPEMTMEQVNEYVQDLIEMRWVKARVESDEVTELLNKIEEAKITVMYQFFVREGKYDMFFRCRKSQLEDLKKVLNLE